MSTPVSCRPRLAAVHRLAAVALVGVAGCQSYEPAPLDLDAHVAAWERRATEHEPLEAFAARLDRHGRAVPARFALHDGVTSAEGEVVALFHNSELRLARLEAGLAAAHAETAGLWADPEFGFDGAEILSSSAPFEFGLTLGVTLPISGRLGVEQDRARAVHRVELRRLVEREWKVRSDVRRSWGDWSLTVERVRQLESLVARVEEIEALVSRLAAAGELGRVEARLFAVELGQRRAELARAKASERRAKATLLGLMGLPADAALELVEEIPTPDGSALDPRLDALVAVRNPTVAVRCAEHDAAEETLRLEIRKQYPDVTIGGGYGEQDDRRALLGISLPIPLWNANRAGIADARGRRDLAAAAAETTLEGIRRALQEARLDLDAVRDERAAVEGDVGPLLAAQEDEILAIARVGEVDALLLLESVTRRHETRMRILELRREEHEAAVRIAALIGPEETEAPAPVARRDDDEERRP